MGLFAALQHGIPGLEAFDRETQREVQQLAARYRRGCRKSKGALNEVGRYSLARRLIFSEIEAMCAEPMSVSDISHRLGRRHTGYLIKYYLAPMVAEGRLVITDGLYRSTPRSA